jgi:hypothetical protein
MTTSITSYLELSLTSYKSKGLTAISESTVCDINTVNTANTVIDTGEKRFGSIIAMVNETANESNINHSFMSNRSGGYRIMVITLSKHFSEQ